MLTAAQIYDIIIVQKEKENLKGGLKNEKSNVYKCSYIF